MISAGDARKGVIVGFEGKLYRIVDFQHVKPGKGGAFVRLKMKDSKSGAVIDRTFKPHDSLNQIQIDERAFQFLYKDGENFVFMDNETYEQINFSKEVVGDDEKFLKEGTQLKVLLYKDKEQKSDAQQYLGIELPKFIELKVTESATGLKGDTVSSPTKEVEVETGFRLQVPLFIKQNDIIKINTETGDYAERA